MRTDGRPRGSHEAARTDAAEKYRQLCREMARNRGRRSLPACTVPRGDGVVADEYEEVVMYGPGGAPLVLPGAADAAEKLNRGAPLMPARTAR